MTKVYMTSIIKKIGISGRKAYFPLENIKKAISWAKENYSNLEAEDVAKNIGKVFVRRYNNAVEKVLDSDPLMKEFLKKRHPKVNLRSITDIAYGAMAAIALEATDSYTFGDRVRTFEQVDEVFKLPGGSAEYMDEVDRFLGR